MIKLLLINLVLFSTFGHAIASPKVIGGKMVSSKKLMDDGNDEPTDPCPEPDPNDPWDDSDQDA